MRVLFTQGVRFLFTYLGLGLPRIRLVRLGVHNDRNHHHPYDFLAITERTQKRRGPALRRLQELKELQRERELEKNRLEQEELNRKIEEAMRLAEEEVDYAKIQFE